MKYILHHERRSLSDLKILFIALLITYGIIYLIMGREAIFVVLLSIPMVFLLFVGWYRVTYRNGIFRDSGGKEVELSQVQYAQVYHREGKLYLTRLFDGTDNWFPVSDVTAPGIENFLLSQDIAIQEIDAPPRMALVTNRARHTFRISTRRKDFWFRVLLFFIIYVVMGILGWWIAYPPLL